MKLVSDNKDFEQRRCRVRVENALRDLTANLLRVTRGAGRAYVIRSQALEFLEACQEYHQQVGYRPDHVFPAILDTGPDFDAPDTDHGQHSIVRGALQITASRLIDQRLQLRAGERELYDGIRYLERARAEHRARSMGRPPPPDRDE